jgi:hypothetical protein
MGSTSESWPDAAVRGETRDGGGEEAGEGDHHL